MRYALIHRCSAVACASECTARFVTGSGPSGARASKWLLPVARMCAQSACERTVGLNHSVVPRRLERYWE